MLSTSPGDLYGIFYILSYVHEVCMCMGSIEGMWGGGGVEGFVMNSEGILGGGGEVCYELITNMFRTETGPL